MANRASVSKRLPEFATLEEAATYWDTHDSAEFEDEFQPVELEIARPLIHSLEVDFDGATFQRLVAQARRSGLGPSALVRTWVEQAIERAEAARLGDAPRVTTEPS